MSADPSGNTGELESLARRAVACRGWRWMPGMLDVDNFRVVRLKRPGVVVAAADDQLWFDYSPALPDLTDAATVGCLLALVRKAWGDPLMYVAPADGWYVGKGGRDSIAGGGGGATEAAALVAALEAAP